jgi:putative membrane protein
MMYWYGNGMAGWAIVVMILNTLLFWGLVIGGIVLLVRYLRPAGSARHHPPPPDPYRILAERFARGEIDEEEYRRRLIVIGGGPTT